MASPSFTEDEVAARIQQALRDAEERWAAVAEEREARRCEQMLTTTQAFAAERAKYFRETETEVVHLALAISRKILEREINLDPDLLGALVRIALDRMNAGPAVKLRVPPAEMALWERQKKLADSPYRYVVTADPSLLPGDCVVETDLGTANFSLDLQFKQIEEGMLDMLKLRPTLQPETPFCATSGAALATKGDG